MKILGVSGALGHDSSAALLIDGHLVASCEEERLIRDKHAKGRMPVESVRWCLEYAGLKPSDLDAVAIPYAPIGLCRKERWHYALRYAYAPDRALDALFNGNRRYRRYVKQVRGMLKSLGFDLNQTPIVPVEHHLSHVSSAYHLSGFERAAVLSLDGKGEYATTFFGVGDQGKIKKIHSDYDPDSLGGVYGALTQYLGFEMLDGEFKVMGMAPYGDPSRYDLSELWSYREGKLKVNTRWVNTVGWRRYKDSGVGYYFGADLVARLGPMRKGDACDEPYVHYAAALQKKLEDTVIQMIEYHLGSVIRETGKLCFAGGVALNVKLNQRILQAFPGVELFVQPAASDAGTAVGAATYVAALRGEAIHPLEHVYLGPEYSESQIISECERYSLSDGFSYQILSDPVSQAAHILAEGHPLAWFQGRMEFGPRALGNRSILGHPASPGMADRINHAIKYRERWRPFCPSLKIELSQEVLKSTQPAPYMTITFDVADEWKARIPEVVHEDGTLRAQVVSPEQNPRYHQLLSAFEEKTGLGVLLNTSLNRRGEPMVCSPKDALEMFKGSDLPHLFMENVWVSKT